MLSQVLFAAALAAFDPSLTAVKLPADAPLAKLLDQALTVAPNQGDDLAFGTQVTKKAFIDGGFQITCVTTFFPSRVPEPIGHFQGCQVEEANEAEAGVQTLTLTQLLLKLGGKPILAVPGSVFCHTRAC